MTRLLTLLFNRNLLALAAAVAILAPQASIAADALCELENATFHGTYVLHASGSRLGVGEITAVGEVTSDGNGNTMATYTASVNGTIHPGVTVTGNYSIQGDCTGTWAESDGSHYNFVISPDGKTITWMRVDSGFNTSGTVTRLGHRPD